MQMNLSYARTLLTAVDETRHGFMKMRGCHADEQVQRMMDAGLVDATLNDGQENSFTTINCITASGHAFLAAGKGETPKGVRSGLVSLARTSTAVPAPVHSVLEKWKLKFAGREALLQMGSLRENSANAIESK